MLWSKAGRLESIMLSVNMGIIATHGADNSMEEFWNRKYLRIIKAGPLNTFGPTKSPLQVHTYSFVPRPSPALFHLIQKKWRAWNEEVIFTV